MACFPVTIQVKGKTTAIWRTLHWIATNENIPFKKMLWNKWFPNDYDGQEIVWIDEFNTWGNKFQRMDYINHMLNLVSDGPSTIEVKGGHVQCKAELVIFTGNLSSADMIDQLGQTEMALAVRDRLMGSRSLMNYMLGSRRGQRNLIAELLHHIEHTFDLCFNVQIAVECIMSTL